MNTLPATRTRVRPSGWWFVLVPLLLVAGIALGVQRGIDEARTIADSFERLGSDGVGQIDLVAGDEATVWAIWDDGRGTDTLARPDARVTITAPGGATVPFDARSGAKTTFSIGSLAGIDLGTFDAPVDGSYEVRAANDQPDLGVATPELAVGQVDLSGAVGSVFAPIGWGAAAALGLLVLLLVLRARSKRRIRAIPQPALGIPGEPPVAVPTSAQQRPPDPNGPVSFR